MRHAPVLVALLLIAAGCGSSKPLITPIAQIGPQSISRDSYRQNLNYAIRFFQSAYGNQASLDESHCVRPSTPCNHLRKQLLRRLLEESVVIQYAEHHHIHLSAADRTEVSVQLARLDEAGSVIAQMVARKQISRQFLRSLLDTELLVHRVETLVVPSSSQEGFAYHLRTVTIPFAPGGRGLNAYHRALNLATDGRPLPRRAVVRIAWIPPRHLALNVRNLVALAEPGQYVGPFKRQDAYLVVQVLGSGSHRVGRSARVSLETRYFHRWIERMLVADHPICFSSSATTVACPGPMD